MNSNTIVNFEDINFADSEAKSVLITGDSGSGKSILMKKIIKECSLNLSNAIFLFDSEGEYTNADFITHTYDVVNYRQLQIANDSNLELLENIISRSIKNKHRLRFDFSKYEDQKSKFFNKIIDIFNSFREDQDTVHLFIDSLGSFAEGTSSDELLELLIKSRKRFRSTYLVSQKFKSLNKEIMTRCNLFLLGENKNSVDNAMKSEFLGLNQKYISNSVQYEFIKYEGSYNNLPCKIKVNLKEI